MPREAQVSASKASGGTESARRFSSATVRMVILAAACSCMAWTVTPGSSRTRMRFA
jgi:hypothetical protein